MSRAFFDTNVVVYAMSAQDARKQAIAVELLHRHSAEQSVIFSSQVLKETFDVLWRKRRLDPADALDLVRALATRQMSPHSTDGTLRALALAARYRLSVWDATIVQDALDSGCDVLYTEDLQAGMKFGDLEVVNPFTLAAHEPVPAETARLRDATRSRRPARRLPAKIPPSKRKTSP